jgi:ankyrin repeat protein
VRGTSSEGRAAVMSGGEVILKLLVLSIAADFVSSTPPSASVVEPRHCWRASCAAGVLARLSRCDGHGWRGPNGAALEGLALRGGEGSRDARDGKNGDSQALSEASGAGEPVSLESTPQQTEDEDESWKMATARLWAAAKEGDLSRAQAALDGGAKLDLQDEDGMNAMHQASAWGRKDVLELLMQRGGSITAAASDGSSVLHLAAYYGHAGITQMLVKGGADVTGKDLEGSSPLHNAAYKGHTEIAAILLDSGAVVDVRQDCNGCAPIRPRGVLSAPCCGGRGFRD